jgi:large subunit ribosomal protein L10
MLRPEKELVVAELVERLRSSQALLVADYRGLTMTAIDDLRTELLKHGARFTVVKNTLTRIAAEAAGAEPLLALLEGPSAIAFVSAEGDPVAVAKAISDAARTTRILTIRGGILEGRPVTEVEVEELAKLPPVDVLRGQVVGAIVAPLMTLIGLLSAPLQDLYGLIDARIEQLGGAEGSALAPAAADAAAGEQKESAPATDDSPQAKPADQEEE